jgi:hypothetical protein
LKFGYAKLGRSMPLSLERCGNLGGDVEMAAVVGELARRHPEHEFVLIGRNDLSVPIEVGLPSNVINPWIDWQPELSSQVKAIRSPDHGLTVDEQRRIIEVFDKLTLDAFDQLDGLVVWVGQHGTTNMPLPSIRQPGQLTKPYDWSIYYCSYLLRGINRWRSVDPYRREEVYLNADARNSHKMRDLSWPLRHPVLTQYTYGKRVKHERFGDPDIPGVVPLYDGVGRWSDYAHFQTEPFLWTSTVDNVYSRLEVNGLRPNTPFGDLISYNDDWDRPGNFGLFINEARAVGIRPELARAKIFSEWVNPLEPYFVHGSWSDTGKAVIGRDVRPAPWEEYYPRLHSVRCTLTTPSSGSGWATAKPWEAFAGGTVCFFHPAYDTQNNILSDAPSELRSWLRVKSPGELKMRVDHLSSAAGQSDWWWLVHQQRSHFKRAVKTLDYLTAVETRLGLR